MLNQCIFENANDICCWSSCETEMNACVHANVDQVFNVTISEPVPASSNEGLDWLSDAYFNKNNNDITTKCMQNADDTTKCGM